MATAESISSVFKNKVLIIDKVDRSRIKCIPDCCITVTCTGEDEEAAVDAIRKLLEKIL